MSEYCPGCNGFLNENGKHRCGVESQPLNWPPADEIALKKVEILNKSSGSINQIFDECIKWLKERDSLLK